MGVIIVADTPDELPSKLWSLPEKVLMIHDLALQQLTHDWLADTGDNLYANPDNIIPLDFSRTLVNGQFRPMTSIVQNEWTRLRMICASVDSLLDLEIRKNTANCEWHLLAKDGVYVNGAPRSVVNLKSLIYRSPVIFLCVVIQASSGHSLHGPWESCRCYCQMQGTR